MVSSSCFITISESFFEERFFCRRAGGVCVEGEFSTGRGKTRRGKVELGRVPWEAFLLLLLAGRFDCDLPDTCFAESSVYLEDDLKLVNS